MSVAVNTSLIELAGPTNESLAYYMHGYPSGFSLGELVFICAIVIVIMAVIIVGNLLVIISIFSEAALQGVQNWFVASLGVADLTLGIFVMPFSLAQEVMGYWVFGDIWCQVHSALDVLLCTASILNITLISLDRYWSITRAVEYINVRTEATVTIMIFVVWFLSFLVSFPPLLYVPWQKPLEPLTVDEISFTAEDELGVAQTVADLGRNVSIKFEHAKCGVSAPTDALSNTA